MFVLCLCKFYSQLSVVVYYEFPFGVGEGPLLFLKIISISLHGSVFLVPVVSSRYGFPQGKSRQVTSQFQSVLLGHIHPRDRHSAVRAGWLLADCLALPQDFPSLSFFRLPLPFSWVGFPGSMISKFLIFLSFS